MSSLDRASLTDLLCCGKTMTSIEVTSPLGERTSTLALYTCGHCGSHTWQRDGQPLDRDAVLDVVRDRIAEGPIPRMPRPRKVRPSRAHQGDLGS
ncbi:MAG: hypothetical protein JWO12_698 [Frankiales bacterium]|nr:hypothetical protein [Frankiales bacterium]